MWENIESNIHEEKTSYTKTWETAETVTQDTIENLSSFWEKVTWSTLWNNRIPAFNLAKKEFKLDSGVLDQKKFKQELDDYQKKHFGGKFDSKIWKETFAELRAESTIEKAKKWFEKFWLSLNTLKEINSIIPELWKTSKNLLILSNYLARFTTEDKFKK